MLGSQLAVITILGVGGIIALSLRNAARLRRIRPLLNLIWASVAVLLIIFDVLGRNYLQAITLGGIIVFVAGIEWVQFRYPASWINRSVGQLIAERRAAKHRHHR